MGFSLRIGQRKIDNSDAEGEWVTAEDACHPDAPDDGCDGRSNRRMPSYTGWADFVGEAKLHDLFPPRCDGGLMPDHPGVATLTREHLARFEAVRLNHLDEYNRERLAWLVFWTKWALDNCTDPVFANS
jgi:hypothetical protein